MVNVTEKGKQLFKLMTFHANLFNQKCLLEGPEYTIMIIMLMVIVDVITQS